MYFIAEIGINHNGDIGIAKELINMAKGCGANAVKFQKRQIDVVYTPEFLAEPRESPWGTTQGDQKHGLEFGWDEYDEIDRHCKLLGIDWFASAWDIESLYFVDSFSPPYHKVASAMVTNKPFLASVASLKRPVIMSTGMSTTNEILDAVRIFREANVKLVVMHCVSVYPCNDEDCNIRNVEHLSGMLPGIKIGYSGHERGIQPTLAAIALGAEARIGSIAPGKSADLGCDSDELSAAPPSTPAAAGLDVSSGSAVGSRAGKVSPGVGAPGASVVAAAQACIATTASMLIGR